MTKTLASLFFLLPLFTFAQQNYTIKGSFKGPEEEMTAVIYYKIGTRVTLDTAEVNNGQFTLKATAPYPIKATLFVRLRKHPYALVHTAPHKNDQIDVYLENGTITIDSKDSLKYAKIGGTKLNVDLRELNTILKPYRSEEAALDRALWRADNYPEEKPIVKKALADFAAKLSPIKENFINDHLNSLVALELLAETLDPAEDLNKAILFFNKFPKGLKETPQGIVYFNLFNTAVGKMAPDFTAGDAKGQPVKLSDYRGKYVLLDFWASWCIPCRADHPHLIKVYDTYKQRNFSILAISMDTGESRRSMWLDAVAMDKITWDQASNLDGFNGTIGRLYGIKLVPTNFLIDPNGKIIAKNLRGEELDKKLAEIFPKSK